MVSEVSCFNDQRSRLIVEVVNLVRRRNSFFVTALYHFDGKLKGAQKLGTCSYPGEVNLLSLLNINFVHERGYLLISGHYLFFTFWR